MFGMGASLELGVGDFIAEGAEIRGTLDTLEKIRPTTPIVAKQRSLKDDLRASRQRGARRLRVVGKVGSRDFDNRSARSFQLRQVGSFMGIALLLEQSGVIAVLTWRRAYATHMRKIKRGRMGATHKPHQIRCGQ
jgi:hypothetical protein